MIFYLFLFLRKWRLDGRCTGARCKNRWPYGGHDNSGQIQARTVKQKKISFFSLKTSEVHSRL